MTTLRVRLSGPVRSDAASAWALYDAAGACVRTGADRPATWPAADTLEIVLAASELRIVTVKLPPMPASRIAGAAAFALEDQLASTAAAHHLAVSAQAPDGRVRVVVVARALIADIAALPRRVDRIIAEPELAEAGPRWRWCAETGNGGFVRCSDGAAMPIDERPEAGTLPAAIALALQQARRDGTAPRQVRVEAACDDAMLARWRQDTGCEFVRGNPWRWNDAPPALFASACNLMPDATDAAGATSTRQRPTRLFATAAALAGAALAIHVVATVGEWTALRLSAWRDAREWTALALAAGAPPDAAATPESAGAALVRRYAELRHAHGLSAPDDALPLLVRASPAFAALPPGSIRSALYADGHWTLDLARVDPDAVRSLDVRLRAERVPALIATVGAGTRVRIGSR